MIKLIEFLGRLVVRGYRRAAIMERKVAEKTADGAADAAALADTKADQLAQFFKA